MTTPDATPRKSLIKVLVPIVIIVVVVIGALFAIRAQVTAKSQDLANPEASATPADVGTVLPDFQLTPIGDEKAAKLSDLQSSHQSKVTLLNFWATWCEACMEEMPSLVALREAYKDKGFEVVGINLDQNASTVVPHALKQFKMEFPVFQDPENKIADFFNVRAIPLSAVLGTDRKILYIENGERNWNDQETRKMIEKWLAGQTPDAQNTKND